MFDVLGWTCVVGCLFGVMWSFRTTSVCETCVGLVVLFLVIMIVDFLYQYG